MANLLWPGGIFIPLSYIGGFGVILAYTEMGTCKLQVELSKDGYFGSGVKPEYPFLFGNVKENTYIAAIPSVEYQGRYLKFSNWQWQL